MRDSKADIRMCNPMKKLWFLIVLLILGACSTEEQQAKIVPADRYMILTADGTPSAGNAMRACVEDSQTGLTWELKSEGPGLHNWRNTYSWYNPNQAHHELEYRGTEGGGVCDGSKCDTWNAVVVINEDGFCGFDDWRVPSKDELFSISDLRKIKMPPTVNTDYFPHTQSAEYWSANDYSFQPDSAWAWNFQYGHDRVDWKKSPKFVRLVRGDAIDLESVKE